MSSLIPLRDHIVVRRDEAKEVSQGGILLPERARETPMIGTILTTGSEVRELKKGERIIFGKYATSIKVEFNDELLIIMKEEEALAVIE